VTYGDRDARWERQRLSFGDFAATYDAARPEWPAATARWLTGTEDGGPLAGRGRLRVADVGAGTGKLTRTLVAAGHEVVAVDPSEGMLQALRAAVPGTPTFVGTGEQLPLPDASVDVVTVAQAWHWFDADAARLEAARVLRPGGVLGIAWHVRDETVPWVRELSELTHSTEPDTKVYDIVRSRDKPDTYIVYARFKDEAAFQLHQGTDFHTRLVPPILATVAGEMDLKFYDWVG